MCELHNSVQYHFRDTLTVVFLHTLLLMLYFSQGLYLNVSHTTTKSTHLRRFRIKVVYLCSKLFCWKEARVVYLFSGSKLFRCDSFLYYTAVHSIVCYGKLGCFCMEIIFFFHMGREYCSESYWHIFKLCFIIFQLSIQWPDID